MSKNLEECFLHPDNISPSCAENIGKLEGFNLYRAIVPIRSHKKTYSRIAEREVLTTLVTPNNAKFFMMGSYMVSEQVFVDKQRYCHETMYDKNILPYPNNTSRSAVKYKTGELVNPVRFGREHGIYSTVKSDWNIYGCFTTYN